jgi:hypothetical protein
LTLCNGRTVTGGDVERFPVGVPAGDFSRKLGAAFDELMTDNKANSVTRVRKDCEFQEFHPSKSKNLIDEIDRVLARHYGFSDEELDFILNYDIKYRMGQDAAGEEDE